ncbi:class II aldolase/adducin family protein [Muricomes intestini]
MMMNRIYYYGMTTTSGGNLSILDDNGDVWITPGSVDKGNLTRQDIVCIKKDGTIVGNHKPSSEYPFHLQLYKTRSDIRSVLHAHPPALVAFSIVRKIPNTLLSPNSFVGCGNIAIAEYGLPGSADLGNKISKEFAKGCDIAIMENHGVVVGSDTLFHAFKAFENLDFCARVQINASIIGVPKYLKEKEIQLKYTKNHLNMDEYVRNNITSAEKAARRDMCNIIHRAYDQGLVNATQGSFSVRLDEERFLISPYGVDRKYVDVGDIVCIKRDMREAGKVPSRAIKIHSEIYTQHPEINSIIIAHPPYIMSYAVTDEPLDSRSIPESYILMRDIPKVEYSEFYRDPVESAQLFSESTPIVMVNNDCIAVTGDDLLNAFDRLEVAEYSAKALVFSKHLGEMVPIDGKQISEIKDAFNLK